ncbi:MAG: ATPase, partial [Thermoanaerobaculia bacterium]|nr:ATPase [Thermoanaerobaculia bacterium]
AGYRGVREVLEVCRPWIFESQLPPPGTPTVPIYKGYYNNVWFRLRHPDYDELLRLMSFIGARLEVFAVA